jgi:hypothetical protein
MKIFGIIMVLLLEAFVIKGVINLYRQDILDDPEYDGFVPVVGVIGTITITVIASVLAILSLIFC